MCHCPADRFPGEPRVRNILDMACCDGVWMVEVKVDSVVKPEELDNPHLRRWVALFFERGVNWERVFTS